MASRRKKRKDSAPGWAWMLFGLSIGLAVALVVYLKSGVPGPRDFDAARVSAARAEIRTANPVADADDESRAANSAPREPEQADNVDATDAGSTRTELGFYTDLVDSEVIVPEDEFDFDFGSEDSPRRILLQAGSFPAIEQANARRADLALLGIESNIERAIVERNVYYRVNIGPLSERGEINRTMRQLRQRGIDFFPKDVDD